MVGSATRVILHYFKQKTSYPCAVVTSVVVTGVFRRFCSTSTESMTENSMELSNVVKKLQKIAPTSLAGSWDNVGLLVEPTPPHKVEKILLTNDLTPQVLDEAISQKSNMIISYHPPIFSSLKRLTQRPWKEQIVIKCIENRIAVYSPHTTYDCVYGGVNDWLIGCFDCNEVKPVEQHSEMLESYTHSVRFTVPEEISADLALTFKSEQLINVKDTNSSEGKTRFSIHCCHEAGLSQLMKILQSQMNVVLGLEIMKLEKAPKLGYGMGRKAKLNSPVSVEEAVNIVKKHLNLSHVRLAKSPGVDQVSSVAVCAGSGSSVLRNVPVDLYVTGEMSHHDVLHAVCNGTNVILCEHSNTERGYLNVLRTKLVECLDSDTKISVSQVDTDPLQVV